jgi:hypothetical protein
VLIAFGLLLDLAQTLTLQPQAVLKLVMSSGWSVAIGWALLSTRADRIFHPRYAQVIGREGGVVAWWTSPFFTIPVLVVVGIATLLLVVGARALRS